MKSIGLALVMTFLIMQGSATLAMYEAGKAVICIDDEFEKTEIGSMFDRYPTMYFEPVTSREEVKKVQERMDQKGAFSQDAPLHMDLLDG